MEEFDLDTFRHQLFAFGCGGRMAGAWPDWPGTVSADDLAHVCSREDVRAHCIEWPRLNADEFGELCGLYISLARGNKKRTLAKIHKLAKEATDSLNASAVLSGRVDVSGLPTYSSKRYTTCDDRMLDVRAGRGQPRRTMWQRWHL
jgi:hypothetical protein